MMFSTFQKESFSPGDFFFFFSAAKDCVLVRWERLYTLELHCLSFEVQPGHLQP